MRMASQERFEAAMRHPIVIARRCILLGLLEHNGWQWADVIREEQLNGLALELAILDNDNHQPQAVVDNAGA